jgi:hypothetical protein
MKKRFIKNTSSVIKILFISIIFVITGFIGVAMALPYNPGDTLSPMCDPEDSNCKVLITTTMLAEGINLYYTDARVNTNTNVAANTAKIGITIEQANSIITNTTKETNIAHPLVEKAVPLNALFTDTVYDDSTIQSEVNLNTAKISFDNISSTKLGTITKGANINIQSDWNAISGDALILNKPILFNGAYSSLTGIPNNITTEQSRAIAVNTSKVSSSWDTVTGGINYTDGKVGIGTNNPSEKFEIHGGNMRIQAEEIPILLFEDFEDGAFPKTGWTTEDNADWEKDTTIYYNGRSSINNRILKDNESVWFNKKYTAITDGELSFFWKVNSENKYDFLLFCLDNDTCTRSSGYTYRISGDVDWEEVTIPILAGDHSFKWMYSKDKSTSSENDKGWIDNINFISNNINPTGNLYIDGNVGIGTTSPNHKLEVLGTISANKFIGDGSQISGLLSGSGYSSTAFGNESTSSGDYSTAFGNNSISSGNHSVAFGNNSISSGTYSIVFGRNSIADGIYSIAFGNNSTSSGDYSTAFGKDSIAFGNRSTAFGNNSIASGDYSIAFGSYTKADSINSTSIGKYNIGGGNSIEWVSSDSIFEIGIGLDEYNRANAITVLKNGKVGIGTDNPSSTLEVVQGISGTGTVSVIAGGTIWTGVGTQFLNTFKVGDTITSGNQKKTITSIISDTELTTDAVNEVINSKTYTLGGGTSFSVLGNGNVGIGTDIPNSTLEVIGDITTNTLNVIDLINAPTFDSTITIPSNPKAGSIYFDTHDKILKVYDGDGSWINLN